MLASVNRLALILLAAAAHVSAFAGEECPQILATIVSRYHLDPAPPDLATADWEAICNSADRQDEEVRLNLPESTFAYLSLDRRPTPLIEACAAKDRKVFQRHALDLALLAAPLSLPMVMVSSCHEIGLHLLGADNGFQVQIWAHYFGTDLAHPPLSAGLEYDHKALDCHDQGGLARGRAIRPGLNLADCYRRTRADIPVAMKLEGGKGSAQIVLVGDHTIRYRYSIEAADDGVYCLQNGMRVAGPVIPIEGNVAAQRRQLVAACESKYGSHAMTGPGKQ